MKKLLFTLGAVALLSTAIVPASTGYAHVQVNEQDPTEEASKPPVLTATASDETISEEVQTVITAGNKYIGNSVYKFGGGRKESDIEKGRFDCSGFVSWAFKQVDVELPAYTGDLASAGERVSASDMQPGDLVFFDTYKKDGHVGIYVGDGKFIGSQSSTGIAIADMTKGYWKEKFKGHVNRVL